MPRKSAVLPILGVPPKIGHSGGFHHFSHFSLNAPQHFSACNVVHHEKVITLRVIFRKFFFSELYSAFLLVAGVLTRAHPITGPDLYIIFKYILFFYIIISRRRGPHPTLARGLSRFIASSYRTFAGLLLSRSTVPVMRKDGSHLSSRTPQF